MLNRLTFGPTAESLHRLAEIGPAGWIEEQLAPDPAQWRLRPLDMIRMDPPELIELGDKLFDDIDPSPVLDQLRRATLIRQVHSRRQLYETMVDQQGGLLVPEGR